MRSPSASRSYLDARSAKILAQVGLAGRKVAAHAGTTGRQARGDQGCPCSDWTRLDRTVRAGVRPKTFPRTAVARAVHGSGLVARHAQPNMIVNVLTVPPFLRSAVGGAPRSQFWADFAKTEICHGARTRRWRRRIAGSSRARRSMLPNLRYRDRWLFSTIVNVLMLPPLEDRDPYNMHRNIGSCQTLKEQSPRLLTTISPVVEAKRRPFACAVPCPR